MSMTMFGMEIEDSLPKESTYNHPPKIGGCLVYCSCLSKNPWFSLAEKCLVSEDSGGDNLLADVNYFDA